MKQELQILVVDDEPSVRRAVKLLLEHAGHKVWDADGGESALQQLAQRKFDIVITDFSMPGMPGDQLIARIRQILPAQPIILLTGFPDEYDAFGQPAGKVDILLLKPFTLGELHDAIRRVLALQPPAEPDLTTSEVAHLPRDFRLPPAV
jgi:CheY-like chemotaxis protein